MAFTRSTRSEVNEDLLGRRITELIGIYAELKDLAPLLRGLSSERENTQKEVVSALLAHGAPASVCLTAVEELWNDGLGAGRLSSEHVRLVGSFDEGHTLWEQLCVESSTKLRGELLKWITWARHDGEWCADRLRAEADSDVVISVVRRLNIRRFSDVAVKSTLELLKHPDSSVASVVLDAFMAAYSYAPPLRVAAAVRILCSSTDPVRRAAAEFARARMEREQPPWATVLQGSKRLTREGEVLYLELHHRAANGRLEGPFPACDGELDRRLERGDLDTYRAAMARLHDLDDGAFKMRVVLAAACSVAAAESLVDVLTGEDVSPIARERLLTLYGAGCRARGPARALA